MSSRPIVRGSASALVAALLALAAPAHASLGRSLSSVEADRIHLGASANTTSSARFTVHALTMANHTTVKEFARSDGVVFAVTWQGPGRPDLRQLLGDYFPTVQTDNVLPGGRRTRRPLTVRRPDFVVQSGGHSGAFWGLAVLPGMAPSGFSANDLH